MIKKNVYIFIVIVLFLFSACQATPKEEIVINKGNGELEKIILSSPAATSQNIIDNKQANDKEMEDSNSIVYKWEETYSIPSLQCNINAEIFLPAVNEFPVFKVGKRLFDSDTINVLVDYFTAKTTGVRETSLTKEELTEQLIQAKRGHYFWDDNGGRWESYDGQDQEIENLENQIINANPEVFNLVTEERLSLPIDNTYLMADGSRRYLSITTRKFSLLSDKFGITQLESWVLNGDAYPGEPLGTTIDDIMISQEEAYKKVREVISDLDIQYLDIANIEKARVINNYTYEIISKGWYITLTRNDGDSIPADLSSEQFAGLLDFQLEDYAERWLPEKTTLYIDEIGIRTFSWQNPLEISEVLNNNVPVKSFENIKVMIRRNIEFGFSRSLDSGFVRGEQQIEVNKIVLTNVLVPIKDELDFNMLVPAWIVYYEVEEMEGFTFVFAVNAIDGSSIDLSMRRIKQ